MRRKITTLAIYFTTISATVFAGGKNDTIISGVPVEFEYRISIFPDSWIAEPINAIGDQINEDEILRSKISLQNAMHKYPEIILQNNLQHIYFLKNMWFYDVGFGGTNSNDALYLTNNGIENGYSDAYIESTFHHEFSSILYRNYPDFLDRSAWDAISDQGNTDPEAGVGAIRNNSASTEIDTALCRFGFLTQYSMSDFENDLNMLAENIFNPSPEFWNVVDTYPLIKTKVRLLIRFYHSLDPMFNERYFRKMAG